MDAESKLPRQLPGHDHPDPAWRRPAPRGDSRLPVMVAVVAAIVLQAVLPNQLGIRPRWLIPALESALFLGLTVANPTRVNRDHPVLRLTSLVFTALMTLANAVSASLLIHNILTGHHGSDNATSLLGTGAAIYLTNIVAFALWYWEFDRGGPVARATARHRHPDFLFPQMANPEIADPDWRPNFVDYFYVSFTNATAFSPTDTMPLSRWAKMLMLLQSAISVAAVALVIARAVNVLK
ncbi:MAG TPA: hypothetical protein VNG13_07340 [Mycobacteriales bacterium]|nr:hypothetical protein [Mycobacteriales bacterium]